MSAQIKDQLRPNPIEWKCCHCKIDMPKRFATLGECGLRKGLVVVCSNCANVNVLGDTALHPMTKEEFAKLDKPTQMALARTVIEIKKRNDSGQKWDPFSSTKAG